MLASVFLLSMAPLPAYAQVPAAASNSDQWDVSIAADNFQHIYVLYAQARAGTSGSVAAMTLVISDDGGKTWQPPRQLTPPTVNGQLSPEIVIDSADHRTIYASWLERKGEDVMLAKSVDFGQSWSVFIADRASAPAQKPALAVSGQNVFVGFSRAQKMWVASSHDGGITYSRATLETGEALTGALAGDAAMDLHGNVYLAWAGNVQSTGGDARVNLYISKSPDGGKTWATKLMDSSGTPAGCTTQNCEWGYMGAQISVAADAAGTLYAFWNSGPAKQGARVYFSSSTTQGETWSAKVDVSSAPQGANHVLPTISAGAAGEVRIAWIDSRNSPDWSAYYRTSSNGGATWSGERMISHYALTSTYIPAETFDFLFGSQPVMAAADEVPINAGGL
jgi:BNR repeat protein